MLSLDSQCVADSAPSEQPIVSHKQGTVATSKTYDPRLNASLSRDQGPALAKRARNKLDASKNDKLNTTRRIGACLLSVDAQSRSQKHLKPTDIISRFQLDLLACLTDYSSGERVAQPISFTER